MGQEVMEATAPRVTVILPRRRWGDLGLREFWEFRGLLWVFAARDIKVRYKQTFLGAVWAVLQPLAAMIIFTIFFGRLAGFDKRIGVIPYPIFAFAALVPWTYFTHSLSSAAASVVDSRGILTKVYFPRLLLPVASRTASATIEENSAVPKTATRG